MDELLIPIEEAARRIGVGRSHFYEMLRRGEIVSVRLGRSRRVPVSALEDFVQQKLQSDASDASEGSNG